ncbi:MAG: periplasmic protein TonB [Betaproteobacteria bacterium]|jgi:protein TonB|nr:periplasmic protein TonB [Betaproteobacteria bacterium]
MELKPSPNVIAFPRRAKHVRHERWHAAVAALDTRLTGLERRLSGAHGYDGTGAGPIRIRTSFVISVLLHLAVIFGVGFAMPDRSHFENPDAKLEVVLVNAKSKKAPVKADAMAQHNLDGGGNTDEKRRAQSPLPVVKEAQPQADVKLALRRVEQLEREARQLMTNKAQAQPQVESAVAAPKTPPAPAPDPDMQVLPHASDLLHRSIEIARLEAKISRDWTAYQERPRRKFIGARTQEYRFARYIEDWRQKVERIGEINYPQAARDQKMSGSLVVTVAIRSDGTVEQVDINRPSGNKTLDEAARRIVQLSMPFAPFPADIAKDVDILHVTRTWTFTPADKFVSE